MCKLQLRHSIAYVRTCNRFVLDKTITAGLVNQCVMSWRLIATLLISQ